MERNYKYIWTMVLSRIGDSFYKSNSVFLKRRVGVVNMYYFLGGCARKPASGQYKTTLKIVERSAWRLWDLTWNILYKFLLSLNKIDLFNSRKLYYNIKLSLSLLLQNFLKFFIQINCRVNVFNLKSQTNT